MSERRRRQIEPETVRRMDEGTPEETVNLIEVFYRLLDGWKIIILLTVLGGLLAGGYTFRFMDPEYQATATIYVVSNKESVINMSDLQLGTALTGDYIRVFNMWEVHEQVISNLNLPYSYSKMRSMLSVTNPSSTRMLDIRVTSTSPEEAAAVANEYAHVASDYIAANMSMDKPSIMSRALVPSSSIGPSITRNTAMGMILGFMLACAILTITFLMDDKIKTADDISRYVGLVNLASIPVAGEGEGKKNRA